MTTTNVTDNNNISRLWSDCQSSICLLTLQVFTTGISSGAGVAAAMYGDYATIPVTVAFSVVNAALAADNILDIRKTIKGFAAPSNG